MLLKGFETGGLKAFQKPFRGFERPLKDLSKTLEGPLKGLRPAFQRPLKGLSNAFQRPFKDP